MNDTNQTDAAQTRIEEEIRALKDALRMTDGYKRDLRNAAEQVLLDSALVKMGKWFLLLAIVTGMAVWIGGSVYGAVQLKGIDDRVAEIERKMAERTKEIDDRAAAAAGAIENQKAAVSKAATDATTALDNQKNLALQKLAADQLPDTRHLKQQLEAIAQAGGELNLHCLSLLSGRAVWVLFGTEAISLLFSLIALARVSKRLGFR